MDSEDMKNLDNWCEKTKGMYRFVISACTCYEIHILHHDKDTDIMTAKASLYIAGDWYETNGAGYFERECMLNEQPVFVCIEKAIEDFKENVKDKESEE